MYFIGESSRLLHKGSFWEDIQIKLFLIQSLQIQYIIEQYISALSTSTISSRTTMFSTCTESQIYFFFIINILFHSSQSRDQKEGVVIYDLGRCAML